MTALSQDECLALARGVCPDCGAGDMIAGPQAGLSQDVACGSCGSEFVFVEAAPSLSTRNNEKDHPDRERLKSVYGVEIR